MRDTNEVRSRILRAAEGCFQKYGFRKATIRGIAQEAGVSPAAIYTYFKDKQALFNELNMPEYADYCPESKKKRQEILSCALILFGERGYDGVTMDDIASGLHTSKATIYQYFSGKAELFSQILQNSSFNLSAKGLSSGGPERDVRQAILEVGRSYLAIGDSPERTAIFKTVIRDSARYPELGTLYYEQGINLAYNNIIEYINSYCLREQIPFKNIGRLRSMVITYIGSLQSFLLMHSVMRGIPHDIDKEAYLETTTDVFLNALVHEGYVLER